MPPSSHPPDPSGSSPQEALETNHRILVVDDNEAIHSDFRKILGGNGADDFDSVDAEMFGGTEGVRPRASFDMSFALQGEQALEIVRAASLRGERFSLVFMDVRMPPGWDGLETTLKLWEVDPDLQVVICTAFSDKSWERMMDQLGNPERVLILKKPFDVIEVLQLAHALTEKWSLLQGTRRNLLELEQTVTARTRELVAAKARIETEMMGHKAAAERVSEQALLLEKARDAIMVWDLDGIIRFWNKGAETLHGLTAGEALGRRMSDIIQSKDAAAAIRKAGKMVTGNGEWFGELSLESRHSTGVTVECRWTLVLDDQEQPKSVLAIHTDITERKLLEAKYHRAQRLESIGTLAGGIAHDLNNILQPITLAMDLIRTRLTDVPTRRMIDMVTDNARRATSLVQQVLSFARGMDGQCAPIHTSELVSEIVSIVRETFPKNIVLDSSIPDSIWPLSGDSTQLHQVLLNLCVNARDSMPAGGVLSLSVANVEVDSHQAATQPDAIPGPHVVFTVRDTGVGIPAELHEKIFDPFFTTKGPGKGTGLGLATTLGIVRSHGGFITLKSTDGGGTTFRIFIPTREVEMDAAADLAAPEPLPHTSGTGELILIVDDEEPILTMLKQALETFGYRVITASDGLKGGKLFARHAGEIRAVITDMVMPVMDGPGMIANLRKIKPTIPIIAISGRTSEASIEEINRLGVERIISKPFTISTLLQALRQSLGSETDLALVPSI